MRRIIAIAVVAAALAASALPDRKQAIERGVRFIYKTACDPKSFADFGDDYLWCLYSIGATIGPTTASYLMTVLGPGVASRARRSRPSRSKRRPSRSHKTPYILISNLKAASSFQLKGPGRSSRAANASRRSHSADSIAARAGELLLAYVSQAHAAI